MLVHGCPVAYGEEGRPSGQGGVVISRRYQLVAALFLAALLVGCAQDRGIGESASARLAPHVAAVRVAASNRDYAEAMRSLVELRHSVAELSSAGELSSDHAANILRAADEVETNLALIAPSQSGPPSSARPSLTEPPLTDGKAIEEGKKKAEEKLRKVEEEARKKAEELRKKAQDLKKKAEEKATKGEEGKER